MKAVRSFMLLALAAALGAALSLPPAIDSVLAASDAKSPHDHGSPAAQPAPKKRGAAPKNQPARGQAFSNPADVQPMPAEWPQSPIKPVGQPGPVDLTMDVNQQVISVLGPAIDAYAKEKGLKIAYAPGMCGKTTGKLTRRELDIGGGYCCAPGETDRLPGLIHHTIGIVPLSIFVHPSNPVGNLPLEAIRDIFRGKIRNWKEVGGKDMPIQAIAALHCPTNPGSWKLILGSEDMYSPDIREEEDMADMIGLVAENPAAIGMETLPVSRLFANRGAVKALSIDGFSPANPENLLKLDYPFYRVFSFTTWEGGGGDKPAAKALVQYIMEQARKLAPQMDMLPAARLREGGWTFTGGELTGEPAGAGR